MRFSSYFLGAASLLALGEAASVTKSLSITKVTLSTARYSPSPTKAPISTPSKVSNGSSNACASVSSIANSESSIIPAVLAVDCLKSVPLNVNRSVAFVEFIKPYIEFQSTQAYLKNPPAGWLFPGVDLFGGLSQIKQLLLSGGYKTQWDFEKDIWSLVNILPHDFHFNLDLPLVSVFGFHPFTPGPLVSISSDGLSLPKVFIKSDLDQTLKTKSFTPSAITKVNGEDASTYLQRIAQAYSDWNDPDSTYNTLFSSLAFNVAKNPNVFSDGQVFGMDSNSYNYTFENGTVRPFENIAIANVDFTGINNGTALFDLINPLPTTTTATDDSSETTTSAKIFTTTSLAGYPTPVVMHRDGYTSGYFLPDNQTAVLAMQAMIDHNETDINATDIQSAVVATFLKACADTKKTRLIVDLQSNGGGAVIQAYDIFFQLFPTLIPFGSSRMRDTPAARFLGEVYTEGVGNGTADQGIPGDFEAQGYVDAKNNTFLTWNAVDPPEQIYGDNFTAPTRLLLPTPDVPKGVFKAENMVMLLDGTCGSTCTIFAEFMKTQAGVRSVVMGGRPQLAPMQGVAGSKGAEVLAFGQIDTLYTPIPSILLNLSASSLPIPTLPPTSLLPMGSLVPWPLGDSTSMSLRARFNFRNNMRMNDTSSTPLQFIYEASNCRLFYTMEDLYSIQGLWTRVAGVVWGGGNNGTGKCVEGSTTMGDGGFPQNAQDTLPYSEDVDSKVVVPAQPGLLGGGKVAGVGHNSTSSGGLSITITASRILSTTSAAAKPTTNNDNPGVPTTSVSTSTSLAVVAASASGSAVPSQFAGAAAGANRVSVGFVAVIMLGLGLGWEVI